MTRPTLRPTRLPLLHMQKNTPSNATPPTGKEVPCASNSPQDVSNIQSLPSPHSGRKEQMVRAHVTCSGLKLRILGQGQPSPIPIILSKTAARGPTERMRGGRGTASPRLKCSLRTEQRRAGQALWEVGQAVPFLRHRSPQARAGTLLASVPKASLSLTAGDCLRRQNGQALRKQVPL